jgi:tetratricopeptide (TPR) repeat protein
MEITGQAQEESLTRLGFTAVWITGLAFCAFNCFAQSHEGSSRSRDQKSRPKVHESVTVTPTSEDAEEVKINDGYQPIFVLEEHTECETAIRRYESEVIPLAQGSKFEVPKNKFLYLANLGIGNCYMVQKRYEEAERKYLQIMEYLPIWPGTDDSDYPINFRHIATAQMGQGHWDAAEQSLKKSLSLFDTQIEGALKSESEFWRTEQAGNLIGSKARSLAYLGIVYLREGHQSEALKTAELAYSTAMKPHVPQSFLTQIINMGLSIAKVSGDENAISQWSLRASQRN